MSSNDPWSVGSTRRRGDRGVHRFPKDRPRSASFCVLQGAGGYRPRRSTSTWTARRPRPSSAGRRWTPRWSRRLRSPAGLMDRRGCAPSSAEGACRCRRGPWRPQWPARGSVRARSAAGGSPAEIPPGRRRRICCAGTSALRASTRSSLGTSNRFPPPRARCFSRLSRICTRVAWSGSPHRTTT